MNQLQQVCDFINDMIIDSGVKSVAGNTAIEWREVRQGVEYPVTQKRAYRKLVQAGYNPKQLVEFARQKFA